MKRFLRQRAAMRWLSASVLVLVSMAMFQPALALAAPTNDNFANATVIGSLPFSDTVDTTTATTEPDEPQNGSYISQSIWYAITPTVSGVLSADAGGGYSNTELNAYQATGPGFAGLSFLGYASYTGSVVFKIQAGTTYYLQAGNLYQQGGSVQLRVQLVQPLPNDDFANALPVTALPFSNTVDTSTATLEAGEPTPSCGSGNPAGSVWYTFKPAVSGSVSTDATPGQTVVAAYTGTSLTGLTDLGCRAFGALLTMQVKAGQTYYFQVGALYGQRFSVTFNLVVAGPPTAQFNSYPSDASIFDTIYFQDNSFDPGGLAIQSCAWSFSDGASGTGCNPPYPTHRYATDGDYTVSDTATTIDGRTASASQVVKVRTHDVAITKLTVPNTGRVGQTKSITVGVSNSRYPETVQVQLSESVPGGFTLVGTLTQSVPVQKSNGTVPFAFSYTFTSDDAVTGKVTFQAVATITGYRDALPADNTAISLPTTVSR